MAGLWLAALLEPGIGPWLLGPALAAVGVVAQLGGLASQLEAWSFG